MTGAHSSSVAPRWELIPYTADLEEAVREFNRRLQEMGETVAFAESHSQRFPHISDRDLYQESFLLVDGSAVRGAYAVRCQSFRLPDGSNTEVAVLQLPLSEGLVDPRFSTVGVRLVRHAIRRHPLLFALGIGSFRERLARLLAAMRWTICAVPFYFKVLDPGRFLANLSYMRKHWAGAALLDAVRYSGIGSILFTAAQARPALSLKRESVSVVDTFGSWANDLYDKGKADYSLCGQRDQANLNLLYPEADRRFIRLRVDRTGRPIGWAVLLNTDVKAHKQFGNMRVGSIVDCMAGRENAVAVVAASTLELRARQADVIVSNQGSADWGRALLKTGFLRGPSNFLFAASGELASRLQPFNAMRGTLHLNRGDGDGPINL